MVCAQHGRELMGCKSPVGVPTWTRHESKDDHEPKKSEHGAGLSTRARGQVLPLAKIPATLPHMSRPLRIEFPGAAYHVTARGDRREPIYRDDADRTAQLHVIAQAMQHKERGQVLPLAKIPATQPCGGGPGGNG